METTMIVSTLVRANSHESREMARNIWWRNQTQAGRRRAIVETALRDIGKLHHIPSSKEWVKSVVRSASKGAVEIPMNEGHFRWTPSTDVAAHPRRPLCDVKPGMIIQMRLIRPNHCPLPHTAIVVQTESDGLLWVDCGWDENRSFVQTHHVSDDCFKEIVGNFYTVYDII